MKYQQSEISALLRMFTLFSVLIFASFSANAVEIRGTISAVDAGNLVRIKLPAGAVVAIGDEVRIETTLLNIGIIATKTRWRVVKITAGFATANPLGKPTGRPQAGYAAVINTAALQAAITSPAKRPAGHTGEAPVTECDRLAAHSQDKDAVSRGVEFKNLDARAARFLLQAFSGNSKYARHMLLETPGRLSVATRKAIQRRLAQEGRYKGPVDGSFGIGTKIAIDTFAMRGN